jgi:hypothetical protein
MTLTLVTKYNVDLDSIISPGEIRDNYLFGIDLSKNGQVINDEMIQFYIDAATESIERELNLLLSPTVYTENKDFYADDWKTWGYMKATYPVVSPISLDGYLGTIKQVTYPLNWLSVRKVSDGKLYSRLMYLVPNTGSSYSEIIIFSGILPYLTSYGSSPQIPNYWTMKYLTGFCKVPADIKNAIGKLATINILMVAGDFLLRTPGQSNKSISIDGLSQSSGTWVNGQNSIFGARVKQYSDELKLEIAKLRNYYNDIGMITC